MKLKQLAFWFITDVIVPLVMLCLGIIAASRANDYPSMFCAIAVIAISLVKLLFTILD